MNLIQFLFKQKTPAAKMERIQYFDADKSIQEKFVRPSVYEYLLEVGRNRLKADESLDFHRLIERL